MDSGVLADVEPSRPETESATIDVRSRFLAGLPDLECGTYPPGRALPYTPKILSTVLNSRLPMLNYVLERLEAANLSSIYSLVPLIESQFQPDPGNRGVVRGMWQFSRDTAHLYELFDRSGADRRLDAVASTDAAISHLTLLNQQFEDWRLVIAAYNAGPYRVSKAVKPEGHRGTEVRLESLRLPRHTLDYIARVGALACMLRAHNELSAALQLPTEQRLIASPWGQCQAEPAVKTDPASLTAEHDWRRLNPLLAMTSNIPTDYQALLPGTLSCETVAAAAKHDSAHPATRSELTRYRVQAGDSLWAIAKQFGVSVDQLVRWNGLSANATLRIGQVLRLAP